MSPTQNETNHSGNNEVATLAGGCFWCLEAVFQEVRGVLGVVSGYTGGKTADPSYRAVCSDMTGHAEAIQITYDPAVISYADILRIFFSVHDPTTLNRQGADVGTQYCSAIFYHNEEQKIIAGKVMREIDEAHIWKNPLVTEAVPLDQFYAAEAYHQDYFRQHPEQSYCQLVIAPKMAKFRKEHMKEINSTG